MTLRDLEAALRIHYVQNGLASYNRALAALRAIRAHFGEVKLDEISYLTLQDYVAQRLGVRAPATVQYELRVLHRGFTLLERAGEIRPPTFPTVRVRNVRTGFVALEEVRRICRRLPRELGDFVLFLAITGWRRGEAEDLTWDAIDWTGGVVRLEVGETKSGQGREFPFAQFPELDRMLRRRFAKARGFERDGDQVEVVFFREEGRRAGKPLGDFRKAWRSALEACGKQGLLIHDLRRSAVRNLTRAGVPRAIAMRITGHKTESVYNRYDIVDHEDVVSAARQLKRYLGRQTRSASRGGASSS